MAAVAVVAAVAATSACVVFTPGSVTLAQLQTVGNVQLNFTICASGTVAGSCADKGTSGFIAVTGSGQVQVGIQVPAAVGLPASFHVNRPRGPPVQRQPDLRGGAAAPEVRARGTEMGRLPLGRDQLLRYQRAPERAACRSSLTLGQGPDGSPFVGPARRNDRPRRDGQVTADSPGTRPVVCLEPDITKPFLDGTSTGGHADTCSDADRPPPSTTDTRPGDPPTAAAPTAGGPAASRASPSPCATRAPRPPAPTTA